MKVTTELKRIIERAFQSKHDEELAQLKKDCEKSIDEVIEKIEESDEWKAYKKACEVLYQYLKKDIKEAGASWNDEGNKPYRYDGTRMLHLKHPTVEHFMCKCITTYVNKFKKDYSSEKDALLVKLTYEKDIDSIKKLLSEYGITI